MATQVSAEFVSTFEQLVYQMVEGAPINDKHVHFANKLLAMLKGDYKTVYEMEKKEHDELRDSLRPKTGWGSSNSNTKPTGFGPRVEDCSLHQNMQSSPSSQGGGSLTYAPNNFGYSTFSPPCNGCELGERDLARGLWMSGFGVQSKRADFQEPLPLPSPPHSPIVKRKEEVCPPAPKKVPQGAALCATPSGNGGFNSIGAAAPLSPIEQIPEDGLKDFF